MAWLFSVLEGLSLLSTALALLMTRAAKVLKLTRGDMVLERRRRENLGVGGAEGVGSGGSVVYSPQRGVGRAPADNTTIFGTF